MISWADVFREKYVKCHTTLSEHVGKTGKNDKLQNNPLKGKNLMESLSAPITFISTHLNMHLNTFPYLLIDFA